MRVDVVYLVRTQSRLLQGAAHRTYQARAFRSRLGDMISITGGSVAHQFCENLCAAIPGEVQVFEDQHARTFAHDEAVARGIKGAARPLEIVIAARDGMHIIEGGHGDRSNALFGPASDHRPGITTANRLPRFSDRIGTGGAGRNNREVRPFCPGQDRDDAGRSINNHHVDEERADAIGPFEMEYLELVVQRHQPSNATSDVYPDDDARSLPNEVISPNPVTTTRDIWSPPYYIPNATASSCIKRVYVSPRIKPSCLSRR